jgi:hemoglobin
MTSQKQVLLDRIGGEDALQLAVNRFYEKNVAHEDVARFFVGVDMMLLRAHQFKFMKLAFTEIPEGVDVAGILVKSHSRLFDMGLNETHFDVIASNLVETMQELGVAADVIDDAVGVVGPLRGIFEEQAKQRADTREFNSSLESKKSVLLDRIGGEEALQLAVDKFYEKNVAHEDVARFFVGVDMMLLRAHQFKFMKLAFTEIPEGVDVAGMLVKGHSRLFDMGLNETHFDVIASNLVETMQELGVASDVIDDAVAVVGPLRGIFEEQAKKRADTKEFNSSLESKKSVLLDRIGGEEALQLAVNKFYEKNVAHEDVARFFVGVDMMLLRAHQFKFMKLAFTEIPEGVDVAGILVKGHSRLFDMGLNETHFDVIASNLVETMQELGVAADVINDAVAVVGPLRGIFEEQAKLRV